MYTIVIRLFDINVTLCHVKIDLSQLLVITIAITYVKNVYTHHYTAQLLLYMYVPYGVHVQPRYMYMCTHVCYIPVRTYMLYFHVHVHVWVNVTCNITCSRVMLTCEHRTITALIYMYKHEHCTMLPFVHYLCIYMYMYMYMYCMYTCMCTGCWIFSQMTTTLAPRCLFLVDCPTAITTAAVLLHSVSRSRVKRETTSMDPSYCASP